MIKTIYNNISYIKNLKAKYIINFLRKIFLILLNKISSF